MSGSFCSGSCESEIPLLYGMTPDQLWALYQQIQQAIFSLMTGRREVTVAYAQGDGSKSVSYDRGDIAGMQMLLRYINGALAAAGDPRASQCNTRRRAIGVVFP